MKTTTTLLLCGLTAVLLSSCASRYPSPTGFLADYSKLQPNDGVIADYAYFAPDANFAQYDSVIIDPITLMGERAAKLPEQERQSLANSLYWSFASSMSKEFELVDKPGPKVMRLRLAVSDLEATNRTLNTPTTILPPARLISEGQRLATGTQSFAGAATLEAEFLDSTSNRVLGAGIDRQFGKKRINTAASRWGEIRKIFDRWATEMTKVVAGQRDA